MFGKKTSTVAELDTEIAAKNADIDKAKDALRALTRLRDQVLANETVAAKIEAMGQAEREAMKAALG
jgi:uncharacterized coiled-coil protein SlyX